MFNRIYSVAKFNDWKIKYSVDYEDTGRWHINVKATRDVHIDYWGFIDESDCYLVVVANSLEIINTEVKNFDFNSWMILVDALAKKEVK